MDMKLYFVAAVIWIGTVTATLESDSHGNWSNEKNETHNAKHQFTKQVIQPYTLSTEAKSAKGTVSSKPVDDTTATVEYVPSQEILLQDSTTTPKYFSTVDSSSNDLSYALSKEQVIAETAADFGHRVRPSASLRLKHNEHQNRLRQRPADTLLSAEDYRKQYRKNVRLLSSKKLNVTDNVLNISTQHLILEDRSIPSTKPTETPATLRQSNFEEEYTKENFPINKVNSQKSTWNTNGQTSASVKREYKPKKQNTEEEKTLTIKDTSSSTVTPIISLGKFSGPIVVPDLPNLNKYSYSITTDPAQNDEPTKSTPTLSDTTTKSKVSDTGYLAPSPIVLNPLQVGVALVNAGQDINLVSNPIPVRDYLRNEAQVPKASVTDSSTQNDTTDLVISSYQQDQITQQEQIFEVVEPNLPSHSVEIQKSVELFHTAPIQEIHYPMEFVPNYQSTLIKLRPQENDFKKLHKGQLKDRRPSLINIYKNNEIVDDIAPLNTLERSRYEYNVNDNDVVYSATNGQADQTSAVVRSVDGKPVFGAREQIENPQYDQTVAKHARVQGNVQVIPNEGVTNDFEFVKSQSPIITQSRLIENSPNLVNIENPQGSQGASQIFLTKPTNEPQSETRLLTIPQPYHVEKVIEKTVHAPHAVDVVEKKVPYPIEKIIEKQITIPQPFPVHVPIDRIVEKQIRIPYPVHVEKVIEKKVPYAIQRLIIPFPVHFRVPQPVPIATEKIVEKPIPIPLPIEKVVPVEKTVHVPRLYLSESDKGIERRPYTVDTSKMIKSIAVPIYNVQNERNIQQIIKPQPYQTNSGLSYGPGSNDQVHFNVTQFYSLDYVHPSRPVTRQPFVHVLPKKFGSYGIQYPQLIATYTPIHRNNGNSLLYGRTVIEKDRIKDEYMGPVPRQGSPGLQSKILQYATPDIQSTLRRTRQESLTGNTGSFRQSKMEYGFKPPMVPSVQYDEQTAMKVE